MQVGIIVNVILSWVRLGVGEGRLLSMNVALGLVKCMGGRKYK